MGRGWCRRPARWTWGLARSQKTASVGRAGSGAPSAAADALRRARLRLGDQAQGGGTEAAGQRGRRMQEQTGLEPGAAARPLTRHARSYVGSRLRRDQRREPFLLAREPPKALQSGGWQNHIHAQGRWVTGRRHPKRAEMSSDPPGADPTLGKGHRPTPQPPLNGGGLVWTRHLPRATSRSSSERLFSHLEMETHS